MKQQFVSISAWAALSLSALAIGFSQSECRADTWGLFVGVGKYTNPGIASLRYPSLDASQFRDILIKKGHIPESHLTLMLDTDATKEKILSGVSGLKNNVKSSDSVIVFLAGHGVAKGAGIDAKSYFLPSDVRGASKAALEESGVDLKQLSITLSQLPAKQFVIFVDACREDPTPGRGLKPNSQSDVMRDDLRIGAKSGGQSQSSATFFACDVGERSYESPEFKHGVFTHYVLEAIENETAVNPGKEVDLGLLAGYVSEKVSSWAKKAGGDNSSDIQQNPQNIKFVQSGPVTVMKLPNAQASGGSPLATLVVRTSSENADVYLNDQKVGTGEYVEIKNLQPGDTTIVVKLPNSGPRAPQQQTIHLYGGYRQIADFSAGELLPKINLQSGSSPSSIGLAVMAEQNRDWNAALDNYRKAVLEDPKSVPAYERLADLQVRLAHSSQTGLSRNVTMTDAIQTLLDCNANAGSSAHVYSLLARVYTGMAIKDRLMHPENIVSDATQTDKPEKKDKGGGGILGKVGGIFGGKKKKPKNEEPANDTPAARTPVAVGDFRANVSGMEAGPLAMKAANMAVDLEARSVEARLSLGFALMATDAKGANRDKAVAAFDAATLIDDKDSTGLFGVGYALRYFSAYQPDADRKPDIERAIKRLTEAVNLRPNYYEAHRELGYCYQKLGQTDKALSEYEIANANRGAADSGDEVAGINILQGAIYQQASTGEKGERKKELQNASDGYNEDAKDNAIDMKAVMQLLRSIGVSSNLRDFLPPSSKRLYDIAKDPGGALKGKADEYNPLRRIKLPF